jgi:translation elongation factor EF-4
MKGLLIIFISLIITIGCQITDKNKDREITSAMLENPTTIEFEDPEYDFGEISLGSSVEFSFKFKNTGESPLIIQSVKAACGCTVLKDWPKEAILPGESAAIPVVFTAKYPGSQKKYVSIIANTRPSITKVYLTGQAIGPE